jgi:hypothetical protein
MPYWAGHYYEPDELADNGDYINEMRFGGDARSDEEIKQAVYERDDYYDDHPPEGCE